MTVNFLLKMTTERHIGKEIIESIRMLDVSIRLVRKSNEHLSNVLLECLRLDKYSEYRQHVDILQAGDK